MSKIYTFNKKKLVNKDGKYIQVPKYLWGGLVPPEPPEPDIYPYLLVQRDPKRIKLLVDHNNSLYYTNTPQIVADTLSNKDLGTQAFNLSFSVDFSAIVGGTTFLLSAPGLLECKASSGTLMFQFGWDETWYSLDKKYLKSGWNHVALVSDGEKISLKVNEYVAIILDSSLTTTITKYSGFSTSNGIILKQTFPAVNSCDVIVRAISTNVGTTGVLLAKYPSPEQYFSVRGATSKPGYYISGWTDGVTTIETNKTYWYRVISDQDKNFNYYILPDSGFTVDTLPDISSWSYQCRTSTDIFSNSQFAIGYNRNATNEYWKGTISKVHVTLNDALLFDSDTAQEGVDFDNNGCTVSKEAVGPVYPTLTVGQISTPVSWIKVRNINATLL